jgi:hypothetical protein
MPDGRMTRSTLLALALLAAASEARGQGAQEPLPLGAEQPPVDGVPSDDAAPAPEPAAGDAPAEEVVEEVVAEAPPDFTGVTGTIVDRDTAAGLAGARVEVVAGGSGSALTDRAGRYRLALAPGRYQLRIYYPLYQVRRIRNVVVAGGARTIDVTLAPADDAIEEIVVEAEPERRTEAGLLEIRKRAATVSDSLSAQEMSRSPDSAASEAAKRVVSVTVEDGRYVLIRGLGDRYVTALLNRAPLPSTEPDRQAVPLDLFPTSLLANLSINKSYSAEHPASFAGGTMLVESTDYPDDLSVKLKVGTSGDTQATGRDQQTYAGGGLDFLGYDDGARALPDEVPSDRPARVSNDLDAGDMEDIGEAFENRWGTESRTAYPNLSLGATVGDTLRTSRGEIGAIGSLSFSHKLSSREASRAKVQNTGGELQYREQRLSSRGSESAAVGALGAAGWKPSADHQVDLFGMYVHAGDDASERLSGVSDNDSMEVEETRLSFVERTMGFVQLASRHRSRRAGDLEVRWQGNASWIGRDEPDTRDIVYGLLGDGRRRFKNEAGSGERFYSELSEDGLGTSLDVSLPLGPITLGAGGSFQRSERSFSARRFRFTFVGSDPATLLLPPEEIFAPEHIGPDFRLEERTSQTDAYDASQQIAAGYGAIAAELGRLRLHGGLRYETAAQELGAGSPYALGMADPDDQVDRSDRDWAPSSSLVYALTGEMNLRAAYSYTLARPRFREVAPFLFTDYTRGLNISGNPGLRQARIHNADLRWEWFAGDTDVFAASLFYKRFRDPIEAVVVSSGGDISFANAAGARAVGGELEARLSLGRVHPALRELRLWSNATLTRTRIELRDEDVRSQTSSSRALEGQAPLVFNLGASWSHPASGTEATLLYNVVGRRIEEIGFNTLPDTYREPVHLVDVAASQSLGGDLTLKLGASNLLAQSIVLRQGALDVYRLNPGVTVSAALEWTP